MCTAIRFPPDVHEALKETADELGVAVNWLVVRLCEEGMDHMDLSKFSMVREPRPVVPAGDAPAHTGPFTGGELK